MTNTFSDYLDLPSATWQYSAINTGSQPSTPRELSNSTSGPTRRRTNFRGTNRQDKPYARPAPLGPPQPAPIAARGRALSPETLGEIGVAVEDARGNRLAYPYHSEFPPIRIVDASEEPFVDGRRAPRVRKSREDGAEANNRFVGGKNAESISSPSVGPMRIHGGSQDVAKPRISYGGIGRSSSPIVAFHERAQTLSHAAGMEKFGSSPPEEMAQIPVEISAGQPWQNTEGNNAFGAAQAPPFDHIGTAGISIAAKSTLSEVTDFTFDDKSNDPDIDALFTDNDDQNDQSEWDRIVALHTPGSLTSSEMFPDLVFDPERGM